ncbi:GEVED domain-containing protein, partial [Flavobacterium sp.]|uniref:GEVED domain-containing protein n=1 Tax=Flavobacterium sp. TaxID=239 RepID=UPI00391D6B9B
MMNNYNSLSYRKFSKLSSQEPEVVGNSSNAKGSMRTSWLMSVVLFFLLVLGNEAFAQVTTYSFAQSSGTYTPITGGTVLATQTTPNGTSAAALDDVNYTIALPFSFVFNGVTYASGSNIYANTNGFVSFGTTAPTAGTYGPIGSTNVYDGAISAFGLDCNGGYAVVGSGTAGSAVLTVTTGSTGPILIGATISGTGIPTGSTVVSKTATQVTISANVTSTGSGRTFHVAMGQIRTEVLGTAPNRSLVIQYRNMRPYNTSSNTLDYQIVLNETTNAVSVIYGTAVGSTTSTAPQVGLRGTTNAAFSNRSSTTSWASTLAGTVNTSSVTYSSTVLPASGLTFTWTPPSCSAPALGAVSNLTSTSSTLNWSAASPVPSGGYQYEVRTSGAAGSGATGLVTSGSTTGLSFNVTGLTANTAYTYHLRSDCGSGVFSSWNSSSFFTGYCIATSTGQASWISAFSTSGGTANINYSSPTAATGTGGYQNLTATNSVSGFVGGSSIGLSMTAGGPTCGFGVWVDWNNNFTFESGERVFVTSGFVTTTTGSFSIPGGTAIGTYRMRVLVDFNVSAPASACGNITRGEYVDFAFNVVAAPSCTPPGAATSSGLTANGATLTWTAPTIIPADGYEFFFATTNTAPTAGTTPSGTTAAGVLTTSLSGLTPQTQYFFWVRANCSPSDKSGWSGPTTFTTPCVAVAMPYSESFETAVVPNLPACVTSSHPLTRSTTTTGAAPRPGTIYQNIRWTPTVNKYVYSAPLALTASTSYDMGAWYLTDGISGWTSIKLFVNTSPTVTGATLLTTVSNATNTTYQKIQGSYIAPTTGTYYFFIEVIHTSGPNDMSIDDLFAVITPTCFEPTPLTPTTTLNSATVSWTASSSTPANGYEYIYSTTNTAPTAGSTPTGSVAAGVTTATFSGLTIDTNYFWWVRANCDGVDKSAWAAGATFRPGYCVPVYSFGKTSGDLISNISITGTTLSNNSGTAQTNPAYTYFTGQPNFTGTLQAGSSYSVNVTVGTWGGQAVRAWIDYNDNGVFEASEIIGASTIAPGQGNAGPFPPASFNITLACNPPLGVHRMRVRSVWNVAPTTIDPCASAGYGETEDYDVTISAADPCPQPSSLAVNTVTPVSANLTWTLGCAETNWEIVVQAAGAGAPSTAPGTGIALTTTSYAATGLNPSTNYEFYVRAACTPGSLYSSWTGPFAFSTLFVAPTPYSQSFDTTTTPAEWSLTSFTIAAVANLAPSTNAVSINLWSSTPSGSISTVNIGPVLADQFLSFDYRLIDFAAGTTTVPGAGTGDYVVQISTDFGATYTNLETVANDGIGGWRNKLYNLSTYVGQYIKIRINATWVSGDYYLGFDNFKVGPICSGIPNGGTSSPISQSVCPNLPVQPFTVAGASSDIGIVYQWEQSTNNGATWANAVGGSGATSLSYTPPVFTGTTIQYRLKVTCTNGPTENYSTVSEINTNSNPLPLAQPFTVLSTLGGWTQSGGYSIGTLRGATGNPGANAFSNLSSTNTTNTFTSAKYGPVLVGHTLSFDLKISDFATPFGPPAAGWGTIDVQVSTDCGINYTTIGTINDTPTASYRNYKYYLGAFVGQGVTIRLTGNWLAGSYDVSIDNWNIDIPAPQVTGFTTTPSPLCSASSGTVTITGYAFNGTTNVTVGGTPVAFTLNSDTSITATIPAEFNAGTGTIVVTTPLGTGSSTNPLTINTNPTVLPITGGTELCMPNILTLSSSTGGTWNSLNPTIATVNASGEVTGVSEGVATITYTVNDGCSTTVSANINVREKVTITSSPSNVVALTGTNAQFSTSATGTGLSFVWQEATDGNGDFSNVTIAPPYSVSTSTVGNVTTSTLTISAVPGGDIPTGYNGREYQCVVSGTSPCGPETSGSALLAVGNTGIVSNPVSNPGLCNTGNTSFSIEASGDVDGYQWYLDRNDANPPVLLTNGLVANGITYSITTFDPTPAAFNNLNSTLSLSGIDYANGVNGYTYYAIVSGPANSPTSSSATLNVSEGVSIGTQPSNVSICRALGTANFSVVPLGSAGTIQWQVSPNGTTGWTNAGTGGTLAVPITGSTSVGVTYYRAIVNGVSPCGSVTSDVATLTVTQPTITVTPSSASYCVPGSPVSLTASGASTYTWSPAAGLSDTTGATVTASPSANTTYTVTGTDASGCVNSTTVNVVVGNAVSAQATASVSEVCTGSPVQLDAAGDQLFTPSNIGAYTLDNTTSPFQSIVGGAGTVAVTLSSTDDSNSAAQTIPFTFNFGGTPYTQFIINSNGFVSLGNTAPTTDNYFALNGANNNVIAVFNRDLNGNNTTSTSYYVQTTGTAPNRITKIEWVNVRSWSGSVNPNTANFQVWLYESSHVVEMRYGSFTSSSGRTTAGTVQVGLRGASAASTNVRSLSNTGAWSAPTLSGSSTSSCALGTFAAPLLPDNGRVYRFAPGNTPSYTYAWSSVPAGFTSTLKNPSVNPTVSTTYSVVVTSTITGCNATASTPVNVVSDAVITTQPSDPAPICQGGTTTLSVVASGPGLTYQWKLNGVNVDGATSASYVITNAAVAQSGNYTVLVTPSCGTTATSDPVSLLVNPTPTATAPAHQSYCFGSPINAIPLSGSPSGVVFDITGGSSIGLDDQTDVTEIPSFTGIVGTAIVTITPKANECTGTPVTYSVTVNALPEAPTAGSNSPLCDGSGTINLTASTVSIPGYSINASSGVAFIDISTSGTSVGTIADDSEHNLTIPSFTYNNVTYTTARVGNNGVLAFGSTAGDINYSNRSLPAPLGANNLDQLTGGLMTNVGGASLTAICAYWDDLTPGTGGSIRTQTVGNKYIVQWTNEDSFAATGTGTITFQIQLDLLSGQIHLVYSDVVFVGATVNDNAGSATVGLNYSATAGQQYSFNTASIVSGQSISYTPNVPTYSWTGPNGFTSSLQNPTLPATVAASGVYSVKVVNGSNGCQSAVATTSVTVGPQPVWYTDADNDGYPSNAATVQSCTRPLNGKLASELTALTVDCNDAVATINPGRTEICWNNIDDDCDGLLSEGCAPVVVNMATANNTVLPSFATAVSA